MATTTDLVRAASEEILRHINTALAKTTPDEIKAAFGEDAGVQVGEGAIPKIAAIISRHLEGEQGDRKAEEIAMRGIQAGLKERDRRAFAAGVAACVELVEETADALTAKDSNLAIGPAMMTLVEKLESITGPAPSGVVLISRDAVAALCVKKQELWASRQGHTGTTLTEVTTAQRVARQLEKEVRRLPPYGSKE